MQINLEKKIGGIACMGSGLFARFLKRESTTEEEIKQLVEDDSQKGELDDSQREMIKNIFDFDDLCAEDLMTHRTDIEAVEESESILDLVKLSIETGFSRIPVYEEDLDNIKGIVYVKDLLRFVGTEISPEAKLSDFYREPMLVPGTIGCIKLFQRMVESRVQMAVVVDEYGGTDGIVTMEDLVESIVGNIQDEYDEEEHEYSKLDEKTYLFEGLAYIEEVEKVLGVSLPEGDYDTLAGFVISLLGYLPKPREKARARYGNMTFTVEQVADRRIEKIKVEID